MSIDYYNEAVDINNRDFVQHTGGIILGNEETSSGLPHPVAWIPDFNGNYNRQPINLGGLATGDQQSYGAAINDWGDYVGSSKVLGETGVPQSSLHAFRSIEDPLDFDELPDILQAQLDDMGTGTMVHEHASSASDINNLGEMVGASQMPNRQSRAAYKSSFSVKNIGWYDLGVLGTGSSAGNQSSASGISEYGLIVGRSNFKVGSSFVWRGFVVPMGATLGLSLSWTWPKTRGFGPEGSGSVRTSRAGLSLTLRGKRG